MGFLHRVAGVSLRDRVRSSAFREGLGVEPHLPREVFLACPSRGGLRTRWRDYISSLAWEHLGIPHSELANVAGEREVWGSLLKLLPPRPNYG